MENAVWNRLASLSEQELRTQVVIPILERTPGLDQITDVHGINERGLDVIFFTVDHIRRTCYGLQLKRGDISGGGSQNRTVKQIIDQLDLAGGFRHPVAVHPSGEYHVERFVVATNGRISGTAREEIARRITSIPVDFWDLSDIIRRANKVFPEILQTADTEALGYLKYVQARCETLDALDQVTGVERRNLSDVFVEPSLRRRFDLSLADSEGPPAAEHSHSMPALKLTHDARDAVVIGEQNEGKTAILRMLAIQRAERLLRGDPDLEDAGQLPVLVRARDLLREDGLRGAIANALVKGGAVERAVAARQGGDLSGYLVLVDGFSELAVADQKRRCADLIEAALGGLTPPRVVVAARPDEFLRPGLFDKLNHYTIQDFDTAQIGALVRKWTRDTVEFQDVAAKMIERVKDALQLPGSPIPAIIGVMLYEKEHKFVTNTAEAVDRYMVIRLGRYAQEMGVRMEVEWQRKQDLLADVAFRMVQEGLDTIPLDDATSIMDDTYARLGEPARSKVAIQELIDAGVLDRDARDLSFYRTAFRDFFAARKVTNDHEGFDAFFREHLFDRSWGQVLVFAAGLRRHNSRLLEILDGLVQQERSQLSVAEGDDYLYGAYLLGRILSNSDASDAGARLRVLRTSVGAARESAQALTEQATAQFGNIGEVVALVGTEHTMMVTIGVPWLAQQLRDLSKSDDLSEDERYLLMSVYIHLACDDWLEVLNDAVSSARNPRVVAALMMLVHLVETERRLEGPERSRMRDVKKTLDRKRKRIAESVKRLFELKGPLLKMERERILRLRGGEE